MSKRKISDSEDDLSKYLPKSFGKKDDQRDMEKVLANAKKRKVEPAEVRKKPGPWCTPDRFYVYGVDLLPQEREDEEESKEPINFNDVDDDVKGDNIADEDEEEDNPFKIPYSHEAELKGHDSIVTALGLDPKGARLISGAYDSIIKFWDFPAMDINFKSFRFIEPPTDVIHTITYSSTGDKFLMAGNASQARVFDRDGSELIEFPKGYPYIADMSSTKGHVSKVSVAFWHPTKPNMVITASQDSSVRIWDIDHWRQHKYCIKLRNEQGAAKAPACAAAMTSDGKLLAAVAQDGSIQCFPGDGPYSRPKLRISNAHQSGSETSCAVFNQSNTILATRGSDDTLKLWDTRKMESALVSIENLPNKYPETDCVWSPDGRLVCTGTSTVKGEGTGNIAFLDSATLQIVKQVPVSTGSVVSLLWHPELNQIMCGCSDKLIHILYNPKLSQKGVLYSVAKAPKKRRLEDTIQTQYIMNPHALPMFKQAPSLRRQREKALADPTKAAIPEAPQLGQGVGGRLGSSLTASIMKNLVKHDVIDDDPRAALLKYANTEPIWFAAYQKTQPVTIFDTRPDPDDNDSELSKEKEREEQLFPSQKAKDQKEKKEEKS